MRRFLRRTVAGQGGFTLIELLIVVAILGILAAVIVPNLGRVLGRAGSEATNIEYENIRNAVSAMMVDNVLASIPNPVSANTSPCTTGTQAMGSFPDTTSSWSGTLGKVRDPSGTAYATGDVAGYRLRGHDITGGGVATPTVDYLGSASTSSCYTVDSNGTVTQYDTAGVQTNP